MKRQLSITLVTESEYKNYIKYGYKQKPHLFYCNHIILILGVGIFYLCFNQFKKCFTCMYEYSIVLPKIRGKWLFIKT